MSTDAQLPKLPARLQLLHVWRLLRATPDRPLGEAKARAALGLFRVGAPDVPERLRQLWLLEEARSAVALAFLDVRTAPRRRRIRLKAKLAYLQLRLALLVRCIEQLELSTPKGADPAARPAMPGVARADPR